MLVRNQKPLKLQSKKFFFGGNGYQNDIDDQQITGTGPERIIGEIFQIDGGA